MTDETAMTSEETQDHLTPLQKKTAEFYRRHVQGAYVRSFASIGMWLFAVVFFLLGQLETKQMLGISVVVAYLVLMNPPTLWILKYKTNLHLRQHLSLVINILEIIGYTAIIYYAGGLEAAHLTLLYAALIAYVGVVAPRKLPFILAAICAVSLASMAVLVRLGILPDQTRFPNHQVPWIDQVTILVVTIGMLFVVAFIASYAGLRLKRARETTERFAEEMEIIAEIGRLISSTLEVKQLYERMAVKMSQLLSFDTLRINLLNLQQEDTLDVVYVYGLDIPDRQVGDSYPLKGTVLDEVIRTRKGVIVQSENPRDLIERFPSLSVSTQAGMRSTMSVPLLSEDKLIGNLLMRSRKPAAYTERDLRLAERIGIQIAGAIANTRLYSEIRKTEKSLRESEGRFRALFEQAAVGVAEIEMSTGRFFKVNRRLCEMLGRSEEEMLATDFHMLTHPEDRHLHLEKTALLLAGDINYYDLEKRYLKKDGGSIAVKLAVSPLWKPGEKPGSNMIVVEDITERTKAQEELQKTLENLRKAVGATIQALVSAVEVRDPYTSGHQARTADLARAIAREMGFPQDKIDAIRMAGSIHDIGKLSIPSEILSKPTKLTEIEFSLIKEHSRKGFEMLKGVESPWPMAEIVYQHHERLDGSGYPRKLKEKEILIEARILAVSDVVESMASHRPYRPSLGIDAALNEIERNRGILYDDAVAGACLRLFREKGYQLART